MQQFEWQYCDCIPSHKFKFCLAEMLLHSILNL